MLQALRRWDRTARVLAAALLCRGMRGQDDTSPPDR
jgi:hypothetical protein